MGATSCQSCGATIEPNYHPKYCRRCGARLHFFEENHEIFIEPIPASAIPQARIEPTAKPQAELEFLTELRKQINAPLRGLRTLWVSFAPIQLPVPIAEFKIDSHDDKRNQAEDNLRQLLQQRLDSVDKIVPIIKQRLQEVDIQVITREEALTRSGQSCLIIYLNLGAPKKKARYSVRIDLEQEVQLVREPAIIFTTRTWQYQSGERKYFADEKRNALLTAIEEGMDYFIYNYRTV